MSTKVKIFNRASNLLGQEPLSSPDTNSKISRAFDSCYDMIVNELISDGAWQFSKKVAQVPKLDETPIDGYSGVFEYPADCLIALQPINDYPLADAFDYNSQRGFRTRMKIVGNKIYTNTDALKLEYIYLNTDISKWYSGFLACVAYKIAIESCYKITGDSARETRLADIYYKKIYPDAVAETVMQERPEAMPSVMELTAYED